MTEAIELESAKLMNQFSGDRQTFLCIRHLALRGKRHFQCLSLPKGFLFIDLPTSQNHGLPGSMEVGMAAGVGRLLGGHVGSQLAQVAVMGAGAAAGKPQIAQTFEMAREEELPEIMKLRKLSFHVKYEDIKWATIDAPRSMSNVAGLVRFKAKKVGKVEIEPIGQDDMCSAVETFQKRLGDKVKVRTAFDPRWRRFVKLRKNPK